MVFFFEIPPFEELQDPGSSPRREEVGRRTLGAYGGFLLSFFYRARFQLCTRQISRESTSYLYEVKVGSRFSRNGPVNLGRRGAPEVRDGYGLRADTRRLPESVSQTRAQRLPARRAAKPALGSYPALTIHPPTPRASPVMAIQPL